VQKFRALKNYCRFFFIKANRPFQPVSQPPEIPPAGLRADPADRTQRRRVGRIQLHRIVQRTPPFSDL